jgi:hypothetical protein
MKKYIILAIVLISSLTILISNSSHKTLTEIKSSESVSCEVCDPGSTTPSVTIDYAQQEGNRCCIYFVGPPYTYFQVSYACQQSFLCETTTDAYGEAKCCYPGIAPCSEIAIVTGSGCECYSIPTCN